MLHLKNLKPYSLILTALLLASCASSTEQLVIKSEAALIERHTYARPHGVKSPKIKLKIITPEIALELADDIKNGKRQPYVFFAYDEHNYITLSGWLQNILRYDKSQNAVIKAYEKDIKTYNMLLRKHNKGD